ncbi:MAG: bifunctional 3,4-dihydroxy-2-butanone-4-phosphate synthase/GTP cyclohydrolase II, partial [Microcystaceae cyanobacterium]
QEGRGIGVVNKLKAYSLQGLGFDTVEANGRLGFPADLRDYGMGAQMLNDLGVKNIRLITNNPRKIAGLKGYGLEVIERVPLLIEANDYNSNYLATKAEKLGHLLLKSYLVTIALTGKDSWQNPSERYQQLEKLRQLIKPTPLLLQEEARPVAIALFGKSALIVHLGLDQAVESAQPWYQDSQHSDYQAIFHCLDQMATWPDLHGLEFLVANGDDPMLGLQVTLARIPFLFAEKPSQTVPIPLPQTIYSYGHR